MKKRTFLALLFCFLLPLTGCGGDERIDLVKNGYFSGYQRTTIGKAFDASFDSPKWAMETSPKGSEYVVFTGKIKADMHNARKKVITSAFYQYHLSHWTDRMAWYLVDKSVIEHWDILVDELRRKEKELDPLVYSDITKYHQMDKALLSEYQKRADLEGIIDKYVWAKGDTVTFKWLVHPDGKSFRLEVFGGKTVASGGADDMIRFIYSE